MNDINNLSIRILIVDDNKSSRDLLEDLLVQKGYDIRLASDGLEAIEIIENEGVDLVLTDLKMPGADGLEVLRNAIRIDPNILVVIITGYASLDTAVESIREGAFDYIKKPFGLDEILILVRKAVERIRLIKENRLLFEKLQTTHEEMKRLRAKKERLEKKIQSLNESLESFEGKLAHHVLSVKKFPFNFLPYQSPNNSEVKKWEMVKELDKLFLLMGEGIIDENEFRTLKKRLLSML
ncbi:MAG: sigma-54-dependent Fis family transcriptional regulator [Deltaproteobacteria bacterium]|nr:sigma-54-dependent Fis family transcriptional regulator [Deltaproteobacteria bacterium]